MCTSVHCAACQLERPHSACSCVRVCVCTYSHDRFCIAARESAHVCAYFRHAPAHRRYADTTYMLCLFVRKVWRVSVFVYMSCLQFHASAPDRKRFHTVVRTLNALECKWAVETARLCSRSTDPKHSGPRSACASGMHCRSILTIAGDTAMMRVR